MLIINTIKLYKFIGILKKKYIFTSSNKQLKNNNQNLNTMKATEFSTRIKNFTIKGLFEVNEEVNMMQLSKCEKWHLTQENNYIYDAIIAAYLNAKYGILFGFKEDCFIVSEDEDNLFIQDADNLFVLHIANIQAIKSLTLKEAITF